MAAYTTIDDPSAYFKVQLYTGDGTDNRAVTFDDTDTDMQPDFLWIKNRDSAFAHAIFDAVRGSSKMLVSSSSDAEQTDAGSGGLTSFDADGFTTDAGGGSNPYRNTNQDTDNYVAFCWKESVTAGFDILTYTGNATNRTIAHNLSAVPQVVIVKRTDATTAWSSLHLNGAGSTHRMVLNDSAAKEDDATMWQDTDPTSSVFTLGTSSSTNVNTGTYVAYCFAEKQGFSKFGSYTGNGNADGTFVYTGFRPAYILFKKTSDVSEWSIFDNKRNTFNVVDNHLYADLTNAEGADDDLDFLSNGFKFIRDGGNTNASGATYIYMAFAEAPFVNSNGVPCNAR